MKIIEGQVDPAKLQGVKQQRSHGAGEPFPAAQDVVVELERRAPKWLVRSLLTIQLLLLGLQGQDNWGCTWTRMQTRTHRMVWRKCSIQ